jgi:sigma-B regulation protein RsbU (phosphoserine phosphatase)
MYVTALLAVLDQKEGLLRYARAGHPPLQVVLADGSLARPPRRLGQMLGMFPDLVLDEGSIALPPGSLALMYSDGLTEAFDAEGNEFTPEAVAAVVAGAPGASAQQVCGALWQAVQGRTVEPTEPDDFVVVALQRAGA